MALTEIQATDLRAILQIKKLTFLIYIFLNILRQRVQLYVFLFGTIFRIQPLIPLQ